MEEEADLESVFSEEDEQSPETVFVLEFDSDDESTNGYDSIEECYGTQVINLSLPVPKIEIKIFPGKYEKPITVAGLFDTGAACSILNPAILPKDMWKTHQ